MRLPHSVICTAMCLALLMLAPGALATGVKTGDTAPLVDLPQLGGEGNVRLADLRGKVVYLDFWASWCGPCRVSFPRLETIYQELADQGFEILAINVDEYEEDALGFLQELPVSYTVVRDGDGNSPASYGILGMPTGFLIDRDGVVRQVHQGFKKSDGDKLRTEVIELLNAQ